MYTDQFLNGVFALGGVVIGFALNIIRDLWIDQRTVNETRKELASALLSEITVLRERYEAVFGKAIRKWKQGQELEFGGAARATNLFAVFDQNSGKLGLFKKDANVIVRAYTLTKTLVESINGVAEMTNQHITRVVTYRASNNLDGVNLERELFIKYANGMGPILQKEWDDVLSTESAAIDVLKKYTHTNLTTTPFDR